MNNLQHRFPLYSKLLGLYPATYRKQYREQMLQTLADMLDAEPSIIRHFGIWLRITLDLSQSLVQQQASYAGHTFMQETPRYVRRNTVISFVLFLPFFLIVIGNDISSHGFYHTWLWRLGVFVTWIIIFPAIGSLLSATTLVTWVVRSRKEDHRPWHQALRDISHNWPMIILTSLGLMILVVVFFHGSVHCITGNPVRELHNPQVTLRCIEQR